MKRFLFMMMLLMAVAVVATQGAPPGERMNYPVQLKNVCLQTDNVSMPMLLTNQEYLCVCTIVAPEGVARPMAALGQAEATAENLYVKPIQNVARSGDNFVRAEKSPAYVTGLSNTYNFNISGNFLTGCPPYY